MTDTPPTLVPAVIAIPPGACESFAASVNGVKAMMATMYRLFPNPAHIKQIETWGPVYVEVLCGTRPTQRPLLTPEGIKNVLSSVLRAWRFTKPPLPGDFERAADEAVRASRTPSSKPVSDDEARRHQAKLDVFDAAWHKRRSIIPDVMDAYWQAKIDEAMLDVDLADQPEVKVRVAEILAWKSPNTLRVKPDPSPVRGFKTMPEIPGVYPPEQAADQLTNSEDL